MTTVHLAALPYPDPDRSFSKCAYSSKLERMGRMMAPLGYEVVVYGGEHANVPQAECVTVITDEQRDRLFDDWRGETLHHWEPSHPGWRAFNALTVAAMVERVGPRDIIGLIAGRCQQAVLDAFPDHVVCEWGVGYEGTIAPHRCFESQAWMHCVYGYQQGAMGANGRFYDAVIPNSFDPADFPEGDGAGGYLLYIGRLTERKGLHVVRDIVERCGVPLVVAGEGDLSLLPPGAEYVGVVGPERRAELMGGAVAVLTPTQYVGPFEGVAVEAQLCGTPAITTDWGAFTETVEQGRSGFRCRTLAEFLAAVDAAPSLDRAYVRKRVLDLYSMDVAAVAYDAWFTRLLTLYGEGWYTLAQPKGAAA